MKNDPWDTINEQFTVGDELTREVTTINSYGALIKIEDGIQGLVHISEFESEDHLRKTIQKGQEYSFKIKSIEPEKRKISLVLV